MNWHSFMKHLHAIVLALILCKMHKYEAAPVGQNYVIIIDAGSSGSRMFVYTWQSKAESISGLEDVEILKNSQGKPVVQKRTPGLSSFADKLDEIPKYISSLLDVAVENIPTSALPNTPLFIMATAGMRLLSPTQQDMIWQTVRDHVKSHYRFDFKYSDAYTISGTEEGLFGWISVNYLLGRFRPVSKTKEIIKQPTDGMLDMGGASMQIAFEIESTENLPKELVSEFSVRGKWFSPEQNYKVYVTSYLGYGMNALRKRYEEFLLYLYIGRHGIQTKKLEIEDPCLLRGFNVQNDRVPHAPALNVPPEPTNETFTVTYKGTGNMTQCLKNVEPLLLLNNHCTPIPCAMNNVVQPQIDFNSLEFYGLSEFFYTLETLKMIPPVKYSYHEALSKAQEICNTNWDAYHADLRKEKPDLSEEKFESFVSFKKLICFKASYLLSALHKGLHFPENYEKLQPAHEINSTELQWSLGALLYKLNDERQIQKYSLTNLYKYIRSLIWSKHIKNTLRFYFV
uniref:GDA1_CD39 domain-containing protein n=1 Tax=Trichobilharzia regenti TaxID=157069 RepID=A0AA85JMF3_TRIRE|nr:unnamed protein product [Trichobilharzia regenti]